MPSRSRAAEIARDTIAILDSGRYTNSTGLSVPIRHWLDAAKSGTVSYPPDAGLPNVVASARPTHFEVCNETTLDATPRPTATRSRRSSSDSRPLPDSGRVGGQNPVHVKGQGSRTMNP